MKKITLITTLLFALFGTAALAQTTAATTQISNQASATYLDSLGNPQTTNSNVAITVVQAVYGYTITPNGTAGTGTGNFTGALPGQTQNQIPGSTVNFPYQITNTSNTGITVNLTLAQQTGVNTDGDTFDLVSPTIYDDANCNGQLDFGEGAITSSALTQLAPGNVKCIIVAGGIPGSTPAGARANINLTSSGAAPATTATDNVNFARVDVINDADLTLAKTASAPVLNGTSGLFEITYGLSGANAGNLPAKSRPAVVTIGTAIDGILISDTIPAGTTYVTGSATGSAGAVGTTTVVYSSTASGTTWSLSETTPVARVGLLMRDATPGDGLSTNTLSIGATYNLSFKVSIPASTAGLTSISNVAAIDYRNNNGTTNVTVPSNTVVSTSPELKSTAIGPVGQPVGTASGTASYTDPVTGLSFTYTRSGVGAAVNTLDQEVVATAASGTVVTFVNTVRNTGNTTQTFNISLQSVTAGYTAALFQSDGSTGLGSGVTLAPGADYNVVVKVTIPASATASATANVTAVIKSDAGTNSDITTDILTAITSGQSVDIRNNDNLTTTVPLAGTSNTPIAITTNPGTTVYYPLTVQNTGVVNDTYALTTSGLPSGSTVAYYLDTNGDGLPDGSPITSTAVLSPNQILQLVAVVTVPANAAPATAAPISFTTTSNSNPTSTDTIINTLTINAINSLLFTPDRSSSITSPGTVVYQHTLTNNGNSSANVTLIPGAGLAGFTYLIYRENPAAVGAVPGVIDPTDTLVFDGTNPIPVAPGYALAAGASNSILVQVTSIAGLADATTDTRVITATGTFAAGTTTATVTDTTKIVLGKLDLQKTANTTTAFPRTAPGVTAASSEITYTIVATNLGSGGLSNVIVFDPIPTYTDFKFGSASVTGCPVGSTCQIQYSIDGGTTWSATAPADSNNTGTSAGYSDNQDATRVTNLRVVVTNATSTPVNLFPAGAAITITFTVSVR
jgi:trimeric autotransporter adhesin